MDELAGLVNSLNAVLEEKVTMLKSELKSIEEGEVLITTEGEDWRRDIVRYLQTGDNSEGILKMSCKCARYFL